MLKGKVIIVTGAGSGIGKAASQVFAAHGARILVADIHGGAAADVAATIGKSAFGMRVDVTVESDAEAMVARAIDVFGKLDGAFNNAGIACREVPTDEHDGEEFRRVLDVDLLGVWHCMKYQLKAMKQAGRGSIVNNASDAGLAGTPRMTPYAAAKAGVVNMTRTAAVEYGPIGVRLNTVCPGPIRTQAMVSALAAVGMEESYFLGGIPMNRVGLPEEVGQTAAWLLSDLSSYITGQAISVDGGFSASFS
jgi:NAD(P)-dependent dehydrogenase (short-subunit alcohol dehydrogenase family)